MFLTTTHIAIVMEYASGGELFEFVKRSGRLSEDAARFFFQQLISGVDYCHRQVGLWAGHPPRAQPAGVPAYSFGRHTPHKPTLQPVFVSCVRHRRGCRKSVQHIGESCVPS